MAQWSALAALGISALALAVGAYQTRLMQTQARASVWPYLSIGFSYFDSGDQPGFEIHIKNNGVGPAIVRSVRVTLDDKPIHSWNEIFPIIMGHGTAHASLTGLQGIIIPPSTNRETDVVAIRTNEKDQAEKLYGALGRFKIDICYCSIYEDCWQAHLLVKKVEDVSACHESNDEFDY